MWRNRGGGSEGGRGGTRTGHEEIDRLRAHESNETEKSDRGGERREKGGGGGGTVK